MHVVDKRKKQQKFSELKNGDTFVHNGVLYVKISYAGDNTNSINLSNKDCPRNYFIQDELVTPVRCTITIEA